VGLGQQSALTGTRPGSVGPRLGWITGQVGPGLPRGEVKRCHVTQMDSNGLGFRSVAKPETMDRGAGRRVSTIK
jgi:hypothetical protein